jgi:hypothetical protein
MNDDFRLERVWYIAPLGQPSSDRRWYWEMRNHFGAVLQQSSTLFDTISECLADAERAGFGARA